MSSPEPAGARMEPLCLARPGDSPCASCAQRALILSPWGRCERTREKRPICGPRFDARALDGPSDGEDPFFSADGQQIGFFSNAVGLQSLRLAGGAATSLGGVGDVVAGASWGEDGTLVLSSSWGQSLRILRPEGSDPVALGKVRTDAGEAAHLWPQILPGGQHALFTVYAGGASWDEALIAAVDLETGERLDVWSGGAFGRYAASGHLLFWRADAIWAVPFDVTTLAVGGQPVVVVEGVRLRVGEGAAHFAVSDTGTLAYVPGGLDAFAESFVTDRSGKELVRLDRDGQVGDPVFSPDGRRIALTIFKSSSFDVGVFDLERGDLIPITSGGDNLRASWTPDGQRVTYNSSAGGAYTHYTVPFDRSRPPEPLFPESHGQCCFHAEWSPDGKHVVYTSAVTDQGLWILSLGQEPRPLLDTAARESFGVFSPNGRFLAYQSNEANRSEVYVRSFPDVDARRVSISQGGGRRPRWSRDGSEILYLTNEGVMRVALSEGPEPDMLVAEPPELLFTLSRIVDFDVTSDGERLAVERFPLETAAREIRVVLNWFSELERLVPTN